MDIAGQAACVAVKLCVEIYQAYETAKILPDLAKSLSDRVQLFKPRLNQLMEGSFGPRLDPLPHINALTTVLDEIKTFLRKLEDDSLISKGKNVVLYRRLLKDYERLNNSLDQCRGDMIFNFEFDSHAERHAFENETKGLACGLVEQSHDIADEQRFQREMLQGQRKMLSEILTYIRSHNNLNLTTRNSPTIETATALVDSSNQADIQEIITEQVSKEYEIPSANIEHLDIVIGKGTFGLIYKARFNNEDVAIKKPHLSDVHVLEELLNQSRCDSSVFVATVYGFTRINDTLSIIMEFASCGSLASLLRTASGSKGTVSAKDPNLSAPTEAKISVRVVIALLHQIALGIEFIHQRRVIHRDIKPDNILLANDLTPMLTDFGSARELTNSATHVTGSAAGSLYYMAPEVMEIASSGNGQYSFSVDFYSYGSTMATTCHHFYGGVQSRGRSPPKDIALPSDFPPRLTEIKNKCISKEPRNRYGRGTFSGELVSRALEGVTTNGTRSVAPRPSYDGAHGVKRKSVAKVARIAAQNQAKGGTLSGITASTASSSRLSSSSFPSSPPLSSGGAPTSAQTAVVPSPTNSGGAAAAQNQVKAGTPSDNMASTVSSSHPSLSFPSSPPLSSGGAPTSVRTAVDPLPTNSSGAAATQNQVKAGTWSDTMASTVSSSRPTSSSFPPSPPLSSGGEPTSVQTGVDGLLPIPRPSTSPPPLQQQQEEPQESQSKWKSRRWIVAAFVLLLTVVLGVVLGVVFGRGATPNSKTDPPVSGPTAPPPDFDELVALFSNTSPATATALQDQTSNQYRAMRWLAEDVEEIGFDLSTDEDRILARGALAILFYSTNGDGWNAKTGWLDHGVSECDWNDVTCTSGIVTELDFYPGNNLVGTLPREIHLLSTLEYLEVGSNSLEGTIATEIGVMTNLRTLRLWENQLTGTLPTQLGQLSNLVHLEVSYNSLSGSVPTELGQLKMLNYLYLHGNRFTGQVPSQVCAIDSLTSLWADCGGSPPEIECTCCDLCCPDAVGWCN